MISELDKKVRLKLKEFVDVQKERLIHEEDLSLEMVNLIRGRVQGAQEIVDEVNKVIYEAVREMQEE